MVSTASVRFTRDPDPDWSEVVWCAYAWPVKYSDGSRRTFFVDGVTGEILATDDPDYGGLRGPRADAAFGDCGPDRITGVTARNAAGRDGNIWR